MKLEDMFYKSLDKWGMNSQLNMLAEECCELAVATLHLTRNNKDRAKAEISFAEEIADVEFMIAEMKYIFHNSLAVAKFREKKEARLEALLNE